MSKQSFSAKLRELSDAHCQGYLSFEEYRGRRRQILENIDEIFNRQGASGPEVMAGRSDEAFMLGETSAFSMKGILGEENGDH